jgi:hypothetical protein
MNRLFLKQCKLALLLVSSIFMLAGCAVGPDQLGIAPTDWKLMPQADQQKNLHAYAIIHSNLVSYTKKPIVSHATKNDSPIVTSPQNSAPPIQITFVKGLAVFPPNFNSPAPFQPLSFNINPGTCVEHDLLTSDSQQQTPLWVCYVKNLVAIDPSMTDLNSAWGTLYINLNPLWHLGYNYTQLQTHGYAQLQQTTIYIKARTAFTYKRPSQDDQIPFESSQTQHTMKTAAQKTLPSLTAPQNTSLNQGGQHA